MHDRRPFERRTQNQVVELLRDALGYRHLGDWITRKGNRPIETALRHA